MQYFDKMSGTSGKLESETGDRCSSDLEKKVTGGGAIKLGREKNEYLLRTAFSACTLTCLLLSLGTFSVCHYTVVNKSLEQA